MDLWGENGLCVSLTKHLKIREITDPRAISRMALENPPFFWKMFPLKAPFLSGISRPAPEGRILRRSGHLFQQNSGAAPKGVTLKRHKVGATLRPGNFLGLAMKNHETP